MHDDHAPRRHHWQRAGVRDQRPDQLVTTGGIRGFVGVETLDVKRLQALVDDVRKFDCEIVTRLLIVALEKVQRTGLTALDLLADLNNR